MATVQIAYYNALQLGSVTVTSSATNYYKSRLYDSDVGKMWKAGASTQNIDLQQTVGSVYAIDTLIVPEGHNLSGATIQWQYYLDGAWTDAVTSWTQSGSGIIRKTSSTTHSRVNWRMRIVHSSAPELAECWMTKLYSFETQPQYNLSSTDKRHVLKIDAVSGKSTYVKLGKPKRNLEYTIYAFDSTDKTLLGNLETYWLGYRPFFFIDHDGNEFFAELLNEPEIIPFQANNSKTFYSTSLQIQQVI